MSAGLKLAENDINNLPYVIQHKGVNELKNIYKGKPAVLVSTGPSLTKNIHHLQQYKDKTIIIAVAQALRILLAYDIKPDFICTVDFGEVNLDHLKGLMDIDVPLVCLNRTYAPLIQQWQGPKFIVATPVPGFEHTAVGVLKDKGTIEQGGSVAHMCLGLALHIGCDPIMMIGQDLALSDKSHCNLVDSGGKIEIDNKGEIQWTVDDPGSCLNDQGKKYSMGYAQFVPGYFGDQVLTNIGLASFITSFEAIITKIKQQNESIKNICHKITKTDQILNCSCDPSYQIYNSEIINCTEGGADIKGTNKMSLKKTLSNFDKTIKRKVFKNTIAKDSKKLIKDAMKRINEDLDILEDIIDNSRRGLATCEAMEEAQYEEDKSHFEKLIQANEKYSIAAHDAVKKSALASLAIYKENREINNRDLNIKADIKKLTDEEEVLKTRIKRNRLILRSALDSAKKLKKAYKNCLAKLQKNNKIKERIATAKTLLDKTEQIDSDEYFKVGNWAYPYVMSNDDKIINEAKLMRSHEIINAISSEKKRETDKQLEYIQYIEESRKHGKENVQEALRCINSAIELYPDRFEARWGKATMLVTGQTDESITLYRSLIEDYPDNLQLKFEYCLALMNHNLMDCIKEFDQLMMLTDRFDYFLETIADFLFNLNMYKEAKEIYISYLDKFPLNFNAWKKLAKCYLETKDKDSYESCLKKSKKILEI
ncbi:DUF115 domain-containing protein [Candidatus Woesearchaeota archaeon]|nr:DUF115 domain-containing protein [Candidatus Woesearchaeota archaeon]